MLIIVIDISAANSPCQRWNTPVDNWAVGPLWRDDGSMQIYPNEVLKDLSHGSQLGITGLPVSFAEVIVCTERATFVLLSVWIFSLKCFWKLFRKYWSYTRQPMAEMILSSKAYVGVKRSWYWPKWASCLCAWLDCNGCSRVFQSLVFICRENPRRSGISQFPDHPRFYFVIGQCR